ncbi:hypothetical protein [Ramlibacter algicola]|uniref:Uncharacterized protein n=1 Tax=Ramlibacter algicola TaxID=2795217 RepID=A0A934Q2L2_9BURK|nr:hypothetical protein [Ramlibacter algicola]MBK0393437.1 hypothetical protein [Ramlibacter algicola]
MAAFGLQRFIAAAQSGQRAAIRELLAEDVTTLGDGGGKATSVLGGLAGRDRVTNLFWARVAIRPAHDVPPGRAQSRPFRRRPQGGL